VDILVFMSENEIAKALKQLVIKNGAANTARLLRMTREAIANLVAGFPCRAGTLALARERLAELNQAQAAKLAK
jgi:hypothetical protein